MARNCYSEINLHITWHCKESLPLLTPTVEPVAHRYLKQKIINAPGAFIHEIGGTETHVHLAVSVPPTLLISEFIGQLKGASSHEVNQQLGLRGKTLQWQAGYGVVSFGTKDLNWVKAYIRNQREHHACGKVYERLERITDWEPQARSPVNGADSVSEQDERVIASPAPGVNAGPITASREGP